jgi:hypothetical protein
LSNIKKVKKFLFLTNFLVKINEYFEFPIDLDMSEYCIESENSETKYELSGVIIHLGFAE